MKNLLFLLACLLSFSLTAQHETLFSEFDIRGGFGGPIIEIGAINGEVGAITGGGGALIMSKFFIGGYGLGSDYAEIVIDRRRYNIQFRHGGFWLGYTYRESKLVHLYASSRLGWGRAQLRRNGETEFSDRHFTLTPELGLEVNVTTWFKVAFTGGFRWVNGIGALPRLSNGSFSTPIGGITLRFGGADNGGWGD